MHTSVLGEAANNTRTVPERQLRLVLEEPQKCDQQRLP
jgi:hypothetical protein